MMIDEDYKTWGFFAIESQSDESTRDRSFLHTHTDISDPATFQTFIDMWIIVLHEKCRFTLLRYPANESLLKCDSFWPRVIVYIFANGSKIVLFPNLFLRNWRDIVYFIGVYRTLCTVSTYVIYLFYLAWDYSVVFYCTTEKCVCVRFHYWSLSWNSRVIWNTAVLC